MGLREVLSKMKLVEMDAPPEAEAPETDFMGRSSASGSVPGPPTDIRDLLGALPEPQAIDEAKLAAESGDSDEIPDFPAVYSASGIIDPPHGYSAYKVLEIFSSPGFSALDMRAKAAAFTGFLNMNPSGPVPVTDIVQDAVKRDQALDKFEEFLRSKLVSHSERIEKENAALQAEVDELTRRNREKMEANRISLETEQARLARWQVLKRTEERKLFDAVNPFVESNPISTADSSRPSPSPSPPAAPESGQS